MGHLREVMGVARVMGGTYHAGNTLVVSRLLTTKWPALAILCELAEQLEMRDLRLGLLWIPRLENVPADDLTNERFNDFAMLSGIKP